MTPTAESHSTISQPVLEEDNSEPPISRSSRSIILAERIADLISTTETSFGTEIRIGVIDEYPFTLECISSCLSLLEKNLKVLSFSSIGDFVGASANDFDLVLLHIHGRTLGQQEPDETIASTLQSFPVIILSDLDATDAMLAAFESGARGYIPTGSTSVGVAVEIIRLVNASGTFVPPSSLRMINRPASTPEFTPDGPLTSRQMAVLHHLTQGKSNKIIAYELKMSESTVKVHVRNIMKKMQATNRTEVAFRARKFWSAEPQRVVFPPQPKRQRGGHYGATPE
jgi:DNA-binding NarL/FixJ family response regulator